MMMRTDRDRERRAWLAGLARWIERTAQQEEMTPREIINEALSELALALDRWREEDFVWLVEDETR